MMCGGAVHGIVHTNGMNAMKVSPAGSDEQGGNVDRIAEEHGDGNAIDTKPSTSLAATASLVPSLVSTQLQQILSPTTGATNNNNVSMPFECSHTLDMNSLQALHHDDDEDQVHHHQTHSFVNKRKKTPKQEMDKNIFKQGELCAVCGDLASGIHFSVWSCNGCKTFFRRVVIENRTYSCKRNGNCDITKDCRCSCRACRFKKCIQIGMDSAELNIERRRKRRIAEISTPLISVDKIENPLIRELIVRERQFLKLLTSTTAPVHPSIHDALVKPSSFQQFELHEQNQIKPGDQMNFSYWRAKILSTAVEWAKSFDEFTHLSYEDQEAMLVHSGFSILVFSEAFHTPERYTDRIVFPDGLSGFRNLSANIIKERSGLIPTVVAVINNILVPIRRMQITEIEYVLMAAILFFDPECLSLSKSAIAMITDKRNALLISLRNYLDKKLKNKMEAATRMAELLLRISNVHKVAAFKRETLCTIETFQLMCPHPLTMEISKKYADVSFF